MPKRGAGSAYPVSWEDAKPYRDAGFVVMTPMLRGENGQAGAWSYFYDEVGVTLVMELKRTLSPYSFRHTKHASTVSVSSGCPSRSQRGSPRRL
jgi:hypothetical protein